MQSVILQPFLQWRYLWFLRIACLLIFLLFLTVSASAQQTVTGQTLDESGTELPGVSVRVKGSNTGTVSDFDGNYSIEVPGGNAVLVFSYIGFKTTEITVGGQSTVNVTMEEDLQQLDEVVVVGYGTQRKEAVTGSVVSVSGDMMREVATPNITQSLQGRMPGVEISQTSSQPGATMQIRIRGTRSLTASNDPLVVLNGVPFTGSIADINPADIKSIDILKDASSTAIYGSRGANGVVLVTTNQGYRGQEAKISYSGYFGTRSVFAKYPMMNGPEFVALREAAGLYENGPDEFNDVDTDWQDLFYRTGILTSHDITVTGGGEKGSFNFGVGYLKDEGVIPTQQYERISLRTTLDQQIGEHLRVGLSSNSNYNVSEGNQIGVGGPLGMSPIIDPYNEDGTLKRNVSSALDDSWVYTRGVIEGLGDRWVSETRGFATYNSLYGEISIPWVEGLKYRMNLGLDYRQSNGGAFQGRGINSVNEDTPSTASVSNSHTFHWLIEHLLTYDRTFADKHNINVTALYSTEQNKYTRSRMAARDIPAEQFQFYNLGHADGEITINPEDQVYELWGLMSWMGRVMYSYDDRYMLSATVRSDGSSRLAPGHKWHTYPAVSAGWNINKESFMDNVSFVDMLKLRVGYGQTSNQAISPYATLGRLATRPYNFGDDDYATGYFVSTLPNANLGWEYSETWNYGLDFSLLNNRLSGTIEYYVTNTKDLLLGVGLPATSGVGSYTANIGETQNKGLELSLNGLILDTPGGWTWEAGINIYGNRNKLVSLASGTDRDEGNWWFVGHPINVVYDYEKTGLWQEGDPYLDVLEPGGNVGMIKVKYAGDYNEDGSPTREIGPEDRQIINMQPDFQGGFNTRVAYKNFDLSTVGAFRSGGTLISTLHTASGYLNMLSGRRNNVKVDYWTPENTDASYPAPGGIMSGDNPKYGSTLGYFDASYLKIRTITLGYNFDQNNWLKKAGIGNLRLYATVQNPFVVFSPFHKETGMDPETNSYADENAAVTGTYPSRLLTIGTNAPATRNYMLGLNVTF
ncbi:SusC/RagA family TonB-linked outer membrane protein [Sinomicrobium sp. M5D2P17]